MNINITLRINITVVLHKIIIFFINYHIKLPNKRDNIFTVISKLPKRDNVMTLFLNTFHNFWMNMRE